MPTTFQALERVPNACQILPNVVTGGQPSSADLEAFRESGGDIVVDLRDPMEPRPLDEPATAERLGLEYIAVPVTAGTMTDETLERIHGILRNAGDRPVFVHCGSGSRVGGALLPHLMLEHGMEEEDAVGQAMRMGLRSADLLEWGLDYVRRKSSPGE
ncbi:MAG TPA: sulfur transferase domain-containing protein [Gemmatimonadales bacterium]|nr:sulfur transferase domain-containing protein [Gemmatimonadales bacterium]